MEHLDLLTRHEMVTSPFCSIETLVEYSNDSKWVIRYNVACHNLCPLFILEKLANDVIYEVRFGVKYNLNCSLQLRKALDALEDIFKL